MRKQFKAVLMTTLVAASFSSLAVQKDITVNASVDSQLEMTQADSTALPSSITMQYLPGTGLKTYSLNTKIWSNSETLPVQIRLLNDAVISQADGSSPVGLTVRLGTNELTTTNQSIDAATLFPAGTATGSVTMPLTFSQTAPGVLTTGQYSGIVSLLLTQGTN